MLFRSVHSAPEPVVFRNCVITQRHGLVEDHARGIYAVDAPALRFEHCTFLSDPQTDYNVGLQLETHNGTYVYTRLPPKIKVDCINCLWDAGFAVSPGDSLRAPFVKSEKFPQWTTYSVSMRNCIIPSAMAAYETLYPQDNFDIAGATNLFVSPVTTALNGHLRAHSPYNGSPPLLAPFDFEGQPRNPIVPSIGADEFRPLPSGDLDGEIGRASCRERV